MSTDNNALINGLGGSAGFGENVLDVDDDNSSEFIDVTSVFESGLNFFGKTYNGFYLNNNGNITFNKPLNTYTPFAITGDTNTPIIAPFFADVDTEGGAVTASPGGNSTGSNRVYWDLNPVEGTVTVTWDDVGEFNDGTVPNAFQLRLTDIGGGNFTIEFRYEEIQWYRGNARAGFSAADGSSSNFFELPQSGTQEMLDLETATNINQPGVYKFSVVNGVPNQPPTDIELSQAIVDENSDNGVVVGNLATTDPDADDLHTYTLVNDAGGRFAISGNKIVVADGGLLNHETNSSHEITVRTSDIGGLSYDKTFTIAVNDVPEPDLSVTNVSAPQSANLGETIKVNWTVTNIGDGAVLPDWVDSVYLSDDTTIDGNDTKLTTRTINSTTPLEFNQFYEEKLVEITIPKTTATGNKYLLFSADGNGNLPEDNKVNNVFEQQITITAPDLQVKANSLSISPNPTFGQSIDLNWTIINNGDGATSLGWRDRLYLSKDKTPGNEDDILLWTENINDDFVLAPNGGTYNGSATVNLPLNPTLIEDTYYVLLETDIDNKQIEDDETNNADDISQIVSLPPLPNLTIVTDSIKVPSSEYSGQRVQISWTLQNQGDAAVTGPWFDEVYFSEDDVIGNEDDQLIKSFEFTGTIEAGQSITRKQEITLPIDWSGNRWIGVKTDSNNQIYEHNKEKDNESISTQPINIQLSDFPNLKVTSVIPPELAFSGAETTVSWTVQNIGDAATKAAYWYDEVWLSKDNKLDKDGDYYLGKQVNSTYLNPNESYNNSLTTILPQGINDDWHFIVVTDAPFSTWTTSYPDGLVYEYNKEGDNESPSAPTPVELTSPPDLQVTKVTVAPSTPFSGQQATVTWEVTNKGNGVTQPGQEEWYDKLYISKSPDNTIESYYLGKLKHTGSLLRNESYTASKTVNLPIDKWEDYFFVVVADADKQVYEQAFENNNVGFLDANTQDEIDTPTNILLTPPPDLTVDEVSTSENAVAGTEITINYKVSNSGLSNTALRTPRWNDNFYLSTSNTFDKDTFYDDAIYLGNKNHYGALTAGGYYKDTATFTLPDNLDEGSYYVFIITDSGNQVFEQEDVDEVRGTNLALSNVGQIVNPVNIISRPADLVVTAVNASPTAEAGKTTRISWSVSNQGTGDSPASWNDRIIASTNSTLGDGDDIELARFSRNNGVLSAGETDSRTEDVLIPFKLKGEYNLFVQTDTNDDVYEADKENNNDSTDLPLTTINVNRDTPDLEVFDVSAEDGVSGKPLTVSWKVKNIGEGPTNRDYWYDEVFLSKDQSYSTDDTYLGAIRHTGVLGKGEQYPVTSTSNFIVPLNISGDYYVIVRSDSNKSDPRYSNRVLEISEDNNEDSITIPINIALSPVPDLQVTNVDAPQTAISAQELSLSWTVSNFGADSGNVSWTDAVYLSRDKIFDRTNDIYLGGFTHTEGLASGDSYTETQYFTIPRGLTGPFYAFVVTDSRDGIEERGDNFNNDNYDEQATQVILPPPADLVPVAGSLSFNANGIPGQFATINYTVTNQGNDAALGSWSDALYLSTDNQWDINDTLIGLSQHSGDVAVGDEYNGSLNAILPAVVPGDYHVLLHSDIRNQVPETDEENNKVASIGKVTIDFESLNVGGTVTGNIAQGQEVYYKIDAQAGQAIRLQLDSANNNAVNELYIRYGDMPTRGQFDYTADDPFQADPEFVVPVEQDGTYYVLVYGNSVNSSGYTLSATDIPFSVINVETNTVGNVGEATLRVEGARFDSGTSFELINEQGEVISQTQVRLEDSTTAFVTFDFNEQALGSYSIKATQTSGEIATLADTVTVQEGIGAIINDAINGPQRVWAGQKYPINVSYGNSGDVDTEAPLLIVRNKNSATGTTSRYNNESQEDKVVLLYGLGKDVGTDTLRPQESHSIPLYFSHLGTEDEDASVIVETINSDNIEFISFEDWTMLQQSTKPDSISDTDWNVFWSNVQPGIGQTWGDYAGLIAQLSEAYNQPGERIYDVKELFARWYADTDSTLFQFNPRPSISGQLINEETGLPAAEVVLNLYQEELPGRYFYQFTTDEEGKFKVDSLGAGTYKLAIPNGYSFADANQSAGSIDANNALYTISVAEDSGDIDLTLDINSPPPPPSDPSYTASFNEDYPEFQQEMDKIIDSLSSSDPNSSNSLENTNSNLISEPSSNGLPVPGYPGGGGDIVLPTPFGDFKITPSFSRDEERECDSAYAKDVLSLNVLTPIGIEEAAVYVNPTGSISFKSDYTVDKEYCLYKHDKTAFSISSDLLFTSTNPALTVLWLAESAYPQIAPIVEGIRELLKSLNEQYPVGDYLQAAASIGGGYGGKATIYDDGTILGSVSGRYVAKGGLALDLQPLGIPFKVSIGLGLTFTQQLLPYPFFPVPSGTLAISLKAGIFSYNSTVEFDNPRLQPPLPPLPPGKEFGRGLLEVFKRNLSDYTLPDDCKCEPEDYSPTLLKSADPNDILGPSGYGSEKWIPATDPLEYTIRFENMPTATAPAKQVVITQKLDSDLDLRSFRLGSLGWGDLVFQVPENRSFYSERIDLTSEYGIYADITAFIDIATGEIKWEIKAIDPETGDIPTDPLKGFLPPNDENRIGEGFVTYTIKSKNDANTGDRIDAEARIIFDNNEPIDTPSIFNTIDAGKPTSEVALLPSVSENTTFLVKWAGNDETDGSGLATYNVYVSEDDGAFELWQGGTTLTEATFEGEAGRTYKFYSLANDNAGNQQDVSTATLVTVEILSRGTFDFSAPSFSINENGTALASITVNRTNGSYGAAEVTLELSDNTATGGTQPYNVGVDYDNSPIVVSFADGETSKVVTVPINDDTELEGHEIINLSLSNPTNGAVVGEQSTAVIKLIDDDTNLKFNLTPEVDLSNQVLAAFAEAANYWTSIISNTADVNITVGFRDLGTGVLAENTAERSNFTYTDVYNALAANRTSEDDFTSSDNLQDGSEFSLLLNRTSNNPAGSGSITPYLDNDGDANNTTIRVNRANAKGLGLIEADDSSQDALLILNSNSNFTWDFDPSDGISTGAYDFVGLVAHEIGHTLGFDSGVDVLDTNSPTTDDAYTYVTPMDLFRFSADSIANGDGIIDWTASTTDKYFSIDGGNTKLASFSTGVNYGDGHQASHFKDSEVLSIMNPKLAPGEQLQISSVDKQVFDVIGWNFLDANTDFTKIAFSADEFSVNEDGTPIDSVTIVRTGNTQGSHSVNITVTDNTATSPDDYENTSIVVNFADGETTKTVEIPIVDDIAQENDETITLSLSNPTGGATIGTQSTATLTIKDNDTPPMNLTGTSNDDTLQGGAANDTIDGLEGNDSLIGGAGDDSIDGSQGKDTLLGGSSNDTLDGGSGSDSLIGGTGDDSLIGGSSSDTLDGGAGNDTLDGSSGSDSLIGGTGNDSLIGGSNEDTLSGGAGIDTLVGGVSNDTYIVDSLDDVIIENESEGFDEVFSSIDYSLENLAHVDDLTLTGDAINGTGNSLDNYIYGNTLDNVLNGGEGDDRLRGEEGDDTLNGGAGDDSVRGKEGNDTLISSPGNDTLSGGEGDDTYIIDNASNIIVENANRGNDIVKASIDYSIADISSVEDLILTGNALQGTGNFSSNKIIGNALDNTLDGGSGEDTLDGGKGSDTLIGGTGNDIYIVDITGDTIVENTSSGTDTVLSSIDFSIAEFSNVEDLTLTGDAIRGTGNSLRNQITGNALNNILNGGSGRDTLDGGAGVDTLIGGADSDIYIVDSLDDVIIENESEGSGDEIEASINYSIAEIAHVEDLTLTGNALNGTGNFLDNDLKGNDLNNTLSGNDGEDKLRGYAGDDSLIGGSDRDTLDGGVGEDTLIGGTDNDTYYVEDVSDIIIEDLDAGLDKVNSSITWTLGDNLERLTLTGTNAIDGIGNALNNRIEGNDAANKLFGNEGRDTLSGHEGDDLLSGGDDNDYLSGDEGNDTLVGGIGNDKLFSDSGDDVLMGGDGNDTLSGSHGNDTLVGGMGNDKLTGSSGADIFVFNNTNEGIDNITSFSAGYDKIHVSAAGFGGGLTAGDTISEDQILIGSSSVAANNATQRFIYNTNSGALFFDADGNQTGFDAVQIATLSNKPTIGGNDIFVAM